MTDDDEKIPVPSVEAIYGHVGRRLRTLRQHHGLTQAQVAQIINVSPQQYQKYEDAQTKCALPYLLALSAYFGVSLNELLPVGAPGVHRVVDSRDEDVLTTEADLLARLVSAFVRVEDAAGKLRLVQLIETMAAPQPRGEDPELEDVS